MSARDSTTSHLAHVDTYYRDEKEKRISAFGLGVSGNPNNGEGDALNSIATRFQDNYILYTKGVHNVLFARAESVQGSRSIGFHARFARLFSELCDEKCQ